MRGLWLVLALAACGPRPLARWDGCLLDGAVLEARGAGTLVPAVGDGSVLSLSDRWGGLPFLTDDGGFRSLLVQLPPDPGVGEHPASGVCQYREGGQVLAYSAEALDGAVEFVEVGDREVRVRVELRTKDASVDLRGKGPIALGGELRLPRARGVRCPE